MTHQNWTPAEIAALKDGRQQGLTIQQIVAQLPGRTYSAVAILDGEALALRTSSTLPPDHNDWAGDVTDFKRMCRSCHATYDKKYKNFKGQKGGPGKRGTRAIHE